jgi:hypothetical protein
VQDYSRDEFIRELEPEERTQGKAKNLKGEIENEPLKLQ